MVKKGCNQTPSLDAFLNVEELMLQQLLLGWGTLTRIQLEHDLFLIETSRRTPREQDIETNRRGLVKVIR
jgi:hypothetical protein